MMETEEEVFLVFEYLACLRKYLAKVLLTIVGSVVQEQLCMILTK